MKHEILELIFFLIGAFGVFTILLLDVSKDVKEIKAMDNKKDDKHD
jgi:ABC-type antimicrobial peptide transport system permease subunit